MKSSLLIILSTLAALSAGSVQAQQQDYPSFDEADTSGNDVLSIEEARAAFPDLNIQDLNNDGFLNPNEIERVVDGLNLNESLNSTWGVVGASSYQQIVDTLRGVGNLTLDPTS